jgi:hypothetical protein
MPRKKKPRDRRAVPPRIYPKLGCVGGPRDGEIVSALDLPMGAEITPDAAGTMTVRRDLYVKALNDGGDVWLWQEEER